MPRDHEQVAGLSDFPGDWDKDGKTGHDALPKVLREAPEKVPEEADRSPAADVLEAGEKSVQPDSQEHDQNGTVSVIRVAQELCQAGKLCRNVRGTVRGHRNRRVWLLVVRAEPKQQPEAD